MAALRGIATCMSALFSSPHEPAVRTGSCNGHGLSRTGTAPVDIWKEKSAFHLSSLSGNFLHCNTASFPDSELQRPTAVCNRLVVGQPLFLFLFYV